MAVRDTGPCRDDGKDAPRPVILMLGLQDARNVALAVVADEVA
jgi:hypothetical protein